MHYFSRTAFIGYLAGVLFRGMIRESQKGKSAMADEKKAAVWQSGGVNISDGNFTVSGDIVGRDKIVGTQMSQAQLDHIFKPLMEVVGQDEQARQKVDALKTEAAKGNKADDGVMAKLVKGIVGLVPGAVSVAVSTFATPILSGIAGPVTKWVLNEIQGG
ncbi:MAG TPA: hypothetical protein VI685_08270 [Candidatus Angelobacter sp.]